MATEAGITQFDVGQKVFVYIEHHPMNQHPLLICL